MNQFEFLRPFYEAVGHKVPDIYIPASWMLWLAWFYEIFFLLFKIEPPLFITRAEVVKSGLTHYFSIEKAKRELGYYPIKSSDEGREELAAHYKNLYLQNKLPKRTNIEKHFAIVTVAVILLILYFIFS